MKALVTLLVLLTSSVAFSNQDDCVQAARKAIFDYQVEANELTDVEKGKFTVAWEGEFIDKNPQALELLKQVELLCTRAYIMAIPID